MSRINKKQEPQNKLPSRKWKSLFLSIFLTVLPYSWLWAKPLLERRENPPHVVLADAKLPRYTAHNSAAFSPDGKLVITSSGISTYPGGVQAWKTQDGKLAWSKPFPFAIYGLALTKNGKIVVAQCYDNVLREFNTQNGHLLRSFKIPEGNLIRLDRDDAIMVKVGATIHFYDLKSGKVKKIARLLGLKPDKSSYYDVISPDGSLVATPMDKGVVVWDFKTRKTKHILPGHTFRSADGMGWMVTGVGFSPDGKLIVVSGGKPQGPKTDQTIGTIRLWNTRTWKELPSLTQSEWVCPAFFSRDGKLLYAESGTHDGRRLDEIWAWDTKTWKVNRKIHCGTPVAFSFDGKMMITDENNEKDGAFYALWKLNE